MLPRRPGILQKLPITQMIPIKMAIENIDLNPNGHNNTRHLAIIGGGSAAFAAAIQASEMGATVTIINDRLPIGGTCVNTGCLPSKTLLRAAGAHYSAGHHRFDGILGSSTLVNFMAIMDQKRALIEDNRRAKYTDVVKGLPGVRIVEGRARLTSTRTILVNGREISASHILIASGARPFTADIPGLADSGYLTNESLFELDELPDSLIVLGGRYVALESAQMFARLGSKVTILQRSERILPNESADITEALKGYLADEGIEIITGIHLQRVSREKGEVLVTGSIGDLRKKFRATHLLAATGRKPNTDNMGLQSAGVALDENGFLAVDNYLRTNIPGIFGAGDVIGNPQFVYSAAYEGKLAATNALGTKARPRDYTALPWVIFTDPQVAGVGLDEDQAAADGLDVEVATLPLSHLPRALAARDTRGFIRLIRDRNSDKLVGARILAAEGSELLMEAAMAIKFGITIREITEMFHPYLTLTEGMKLAAITFNKNVSQLSCCAT